MTHQSKKSFFPLIQTLNDKHESVRQVAAQSLRKIDSDKAIQLLAQIIKDKRNGILFESFNKECIGFAFGEYNWATMELGNIGTDKAVEPLISILKAEELEVSLIAAEALEKIGNNKVLELLIQALNDSTPNVRCNVIETLGKIGSEKAVESLTQSLKDNSIPVRYNAARALGKIRSQKAVESLIQVLKDDSSHDVRGSAAEALGELGSDNAVDHLIRSLKNDTILVRCCAARALGNIGSNIAVEVLIHSLQGENYEVRREAAKALGKIRDLKAQEPLIQALKDKSIAVRSNSIESLGKIGSQKAVESLIQILNDENDENDDTHAKAIEALGRIGGDRVITFLLEILENKKSSLRSNAARALGSTRSEEVVESLFKSLKKYDEDDDITENFEFSCEVVEALENIASKKAIYYLLTIFEESNFVVYPEIVINAIENTADRNLLEITQQLPRIANIVLNAPSQEVLELLSTIQSLCKYYNYDIAQTPLQETENYANPVEKTLQEIHQTLKTMSETGKYNFKADVVQIIENNTGEVIAKKYANDPALLQTINEITQVLANLQKAHPTATEAEAKDIIEAEFKEIQNNQPNKWTTFRQQLLNPERWLNGGKSTISEIAKHYAENSVFLKAGVAFLDGFSADEE